MAGAWYTAILCLLWDTCTIYSRFRGLLVWASIPGHLLRSVADLARKKKLNLHKLWLGRSKLPFGGQGKALPVYAGK